MKKYYSTFAAVFAAAAITAAAIGPELAQPSYRSFPLTVKGAPSQETVNKIANLATVENYQGAVRVKQNVSAADLAGEYVMLSTSVFNLNPDGISGTTQKLAAQADGTIVFEGILGFSQDAYNAAVLVLNIPNGGPTATVSGNTVTLPLGQFGTVKYIQGTDEYEFPARLIGYQGVDWSGSEFVGILEEGNVNFTVDANGNLTADYGMGIYIDGLGWMNGAENIKVVKPNGTVTSNFSSNQALGLYTIPAYIEQSQSAEGYDQLFVSALMPFGITQYGPTFDLDLESRKAYAIEQVVGDPFTQANANTGEYEDITEPKYLCIPEEDETATIPFRKYLEATFDEDMKTLTFDSYWSVIAPLLADPANAKWYGWSEPAVIELSYSTGGVEDLVVDSNNNAPVEYFNLQGIKVATPEAGQLLIRRQGTEVSKILVK